MIKKVRNIFIIGIIFLSIAVVSLYSDAQVPCDVPAEWGVVFGNKVNANGIVSNRLETRLNKALELYKSGEIKYLLVSGGLGKEGYDEAVVMKEFLVNGGISPELIKVDMQGNTTSLTSRNAYNLVGNVNIAAITQQFHVSRAKMSLRNAGFSNVCGHYPRYYEWRDIYSTLREVAAWGKYWIKDI